jgi:amino acid adenylation domain-containing protein
LSSRLQTGIGFQKNQVLKMMGGYYMPFNDDGDLIEIVEDNIDLCSYYHLFTFENTLPLKSSFIQHGGEFETYTIRIDKKYMENIQGIEKKSKIPVETILKSVWGILIHKYNHEGDVIFGKKNNTYAQLLEEINISNSVNNNSSREYFNDSNLGHFILIVNEAFSFSNRNKMIDQCKRNAVTNQCSCFVIFELDEELIIHLAYNPDVHEYYVIHNIEGHFTKIIEQVSDNMNLELSEIEILTDKEIDQISNAFNKTTNVDFPFHDQTIIDMFQKQVKRTPNKTAIINNEIELSYADLDHMTNALAEILISDYSAKSQQVIAIHLERSHYLMVSILSIFKAGYGFVPIDPALPDNRIKEIMIDANITTLITTKKYNERVYKCLEDLHVKIVTIDDHSDLLIEEQNSAFNKANVKENDIAYVLYTSGTTGMPKGVIIEHHSLVNLFKGMEKELEFSDNKRILLQTSISFDIFIIEALFPLAIGLCIVVGDGSLKYFPRLLYNFIKKYDFDIIQMTPSRLQFILNSVPNLEAFSQLKKIIIGGEKFPEKLLNGLESLTSSSIYNGYGPTEATIYTTMKKVSSSEDINIGKPLPNVGVIILNQDGNMLPVGVIGELYISGKGLARGYLNREKLNNERYIFHKGKRMYRSGDLAKWLPDGAIVLIGRKDNQVKINGVRIELGEIESILTKHVYIKEAITKVYNDPLGQKYLCAFYVSVNGSELPDLKEFLQQFLPSYMIPEYFKKVENMPLTLNGKVNREALHWQ